MAEAAANDSLVRVPAQDPSGTMVKDRFIAFLRTFRKEVNEDETTMQQRYLTDYVSQIAAMIQNNKTTVHVDFQHVIEADFELAEAIELEYCRFEPFLRAALQETVREENAYHLEANNDRAQRELFVAFYGFPRLDRVRSMRADRIGRLMAISGTVTRSSEVRPELLYGHFVCLKCARGHANVEQQYQYTEPPRCADEKCSGHGFALQLGMSTFVDWQRLRVQENADEIPAGSMPRCIDVICRNEVVEQAKAGDRVIFTGSIIVVPDDSGMKQMGDATVVGRPSARGSEGSFGGVSGVKKLGVRELSYKLLFVASSVQQSDSKGNGLVTAALFDLSGEDAANNHVDLTEQDKQRILWMRGEPHLYQKMAESVCPSVFGHLEVKRGVLLMMMGGVHKTTGDGGSLRGDLNVCIVGDPSCAKSQFLKYVHSFLPRTVYTSGKSSSAAGLTASVVRDAETGEFCVEAGALMLADNGICCIDEFDKMDSNDQVAIHEAMEQQTISITKAGIQATLNARTSILAAANPVFGRYDRTKPLKANVSISAPIMSRFDLFFVIIDECNPKIDESVARHIIDVHRTGGRASIEKEVPFGPEDLARYIRFSRTINPIVTPESKKVLVDCYRLLRQNDILGKNKTAYRITVRQLESLIRLSEALARLHLDEHVQPWYVREAYRLLQKSIIFVETADIELEENEEEMEEEMRAKRERGDVPLGLYDDDDGDDGADGMEGDGEGDGEDGRGDGGGSVGGKSKRDDDDDDDDDDDEGRRGRRKRRAAERTTTNNNNTNNTTTVASSSSSGGRGSGTPLPSPTTHRGTIASPSHFAARQETSISSAEAVTRVAQRSGLHQPGEETHDRERGEGGDRGADEGGTKGDRAGEAKGGGKGKRNISFAEYEGICNRVALHLKNLHEEENFEGITWAKLLEWFLANDDASALTGGAAFDERKSTVNMVIRRMIKVEGRLIVCEGHDGKNEDKTLRMHPSDHVFSNETI